MDSPPSTASVIGCGSGGRLSLDALAASPLFELVAAADVRPEVHKSLQQSFPRLFGSLGNRIAESAADVMGGSWKSDSRKKAQKTQKRKVFWRRFRGWQLYRHGSAKISARS